MDQMFVFTPNSYSEVLGPHVIVFGDGGLWMGIKRCHWGKSPVRELAALQWERETFPIFPTGAQRKAHVSIEQDGSICKIGGEPRNENYLDFGPSRSRGWETFII
jgi:hypothetical protein